MIRRSRQIRDKRSEISGQQSGEADPIPNQQSATSNLTQPSVYLYLDIMKASIVDLRYKTKEVLEALDRNEEVSILYRGKLRAKMLPAGKGQTANKAKVTEHPLFGCAAGEWSVAEEMDRLRGRRY